jgi:hypothetical protein
LKKSNKFELGTGCKFFIAKQTEAVSMIRTFILLFLFTGISISKNSFCQGSSHFLPGIHITEKNGNYLFEPYIINLSDKNIDNVSYSFTLHKNGKSGTSSSKQSGSFSIAPKDSLNLSKISVNGFPGDNCITQLKLFKNSMLVAEKTKQFRFPVTDNK